MRFSDSVSGELGDGVLVVTIDNPPVNAASVHARAGLMAALEHVENHAEVGGLVITGAGKTFCGGADIREFGQPSIEPILPTAVDRIEACNKPVVAALNGAALGGGAEIALACHGRVAAASASIGLPEVKLGIVPGAGGTQRLPRLVGVAVAIDLIGTGRTIRAEEALALCLIDAVGANPVSEAIAMVRRLSDSPLRRTSELSVPPSEEAQIEAATKRVISKARGQAAPTEAVRLVKLATGSDRAAGFKDERATFLRLRDSDEAKALRHVFFAERAASQVDKIKGVGSRPVATVGVVGLGLMGSGIVMAALTAGYRVIGVEQTAKAAQQGRERVAGLIDRAIKSGRMTADAASNCLARFSAEAEMAALAPADLIIEAVFDDLDVKVKLFQALDSIARPDVILATNTSYLDPDQIAAATAHPERVVGVHFFSPANVMRLVEVVDCKATGPDVLAAAVAFARKLGKLPVICGVTEGFIGNRVFSAYRREAEFMVEDGALPHEIDEALEVWGFPMGPFAVSDMAGLQIAWARRKRQAATRDPNARYVDIADRLCEMGRLGRAAGRGWYDYSSGERSVDPEVTALIEQRRAEKGIQPRSFEPPYIVARLVQAMFDEGAALLAEGIAARASDIDLVMINGYGFPAHMGGPMFQAEQRKRSSG